MERPQCRRCDFVKVTEPSGYLGNVVTEETGCGAPDCPWRISVKPGQRINVTLINFAWDKEPGKRDILRKYVKGEGLERHLYILQLEREREG